MDKDFPRWKDDTCPHTPERAEERRLKEMQLARRRERYRLCNQQMAEAA